MTNVVQFPSGNSKPTGRAPYSIHIEPTKDGFDWSLSTDDADLPLEDDMAADLASIALSIRPLRRTFLERLANLFTGDPR